MEQIFFGGPATVIGTAGQAPPFRKKEGIKNVVDIMEQAFIQLTSTPEGKEKYGDPEKGATLEQAWRTAGIFTGKWPVCLLAAGKPDVPTAAIDKLIRVNAGQMIDVMKRVFASTDRASIQILYYDGKTGHSISLFGFDTDKSRFTYHDPWPDFSLLCKEYNMAGVDAQRVDKQIWTVTDEELQRVVFAAFIPKNQWAYVTGETFMLSLDELKKTDFWDFFRIKIEGSNPTEGGTVYQIKTGGFQSEIDIKIKVNQQQQITESILCIKRDWLFGPPYGINPFAPDLVRSFISATCSPADESRASQIKSMFQPEIIKTYLQMFHDQKDEESSTASIMKVYTGLIEKHHISLDFTSLDIRNVLIEELDYLLVSTKIDNI